MTTSPFTDTAALAAVLDHGVATITAALQEPESMPWEGRGDVFTDVAAVAASLQAAVADPAIASLGANLRGIDALTWSAVVRQINELEKRVQATLISDPALFDYQMARDQPVRPSWRVRRVQALLQVTGALGGADGSLVALAGLGQAGDLTPGAVVRHAVAALTAPALNERDPHRQTWTLRVAKHVIDDPRLASAVDAAPVVGAGTSAQISQALRDALAANARLRARPWQVGMFRLVAETQQRDALRNISRQATGAERGGPEAAAL